MGPYLEKLAHRHHANHADFMRTGIPFPCEIRQPTSEAMLTCITSRSHKFRSLQPQGEIVGSHGSLLANAARIDTLFK